MDRPLPIIRRALGDYWDEAFELMLCNLLWFFAQLLIITGPPATMALFHVTNRVARGHFAKLGEFWEAFTRYFVDGWKWGLLNLLAILIFGYAVLFYGLGNFGQAGSMLATVNLALLVGWLFTQLFAIPLWLEGEEKRIGRALRGAFLLELAYLPLIVLAFLVVALVIVVTAFLWVLVAMGSVAFLTLLGNTVVVAALEESREVDPG